MIEILYVALGVLLADAVNIGIRYAYVRWTERSQRRALEYRMEIIRSGAQRLEELEPDRELAGSTRTN